MPKQIRLDLEDEEPTPPPTAPVRLPALIGLMAEAIIAVWQSAQQADREAP